MCYSYTMTVNIKKICIGLFYCMGLSLLPAVQPSGADNASPKIAGFLMTLPISSGSVYTLPDSEVETLIEISANAGINVFELIDCTFRFLKLQNARIIIKGDSLRKTENLFVLGDERVLSILPVKNLRFIEVGASFFSEQNNLDIFLDSEYESYIEIGTARYQKHFGFKTLSHLILDDCFGVQVHKLFFSAPLIKLELYAPAKGAIYVKGLFRPKRWNLQIIQRKAS